MFKTVQRVYGQPKFKTGIIKSPSQTPFPSKIMSVFSLYSKEGTFLLIFVNSPICNVSRGCNQWDWPKGKFLSLPVSIHKHFSAI